MPEVQVDPFEIKSGQVTGIVNMGSSWPWSVCVCVSVCKCVYVCMCVWGGGGGDYCMNDRAVATLFIVLTISVTVSPHTIIILPFVANILCTCSIQ